MLKLGHRVSAGTEPKKFYIDIYASWREVYKHRYGSGSIKKKKNGQDADGNRYTASDEDAQAWPDARQMHAAKNKMLDVFLFHVYERWLVALGEESPTLYVHEHLGHHMRYESDDFSSPQMAAKKIKKHSRLANA